MRRRLAGTLAVIALLAGACGGDDKPSTTGTTTGGGETGNAQTITIGVDAKTDGFSSSWSKFFPQKVQAHPGDTIEFKASFTGEPHSPATGSLIAEALVANSQLDPNSDAPPPPEIQAALDKVPFVFSEDPNAGPDTFFVQAASQPCYLPEDDPSTDVACPKPDQEPPAEINGTERFLNTGFLPDGETVTFKLADDMAPGQYAFMCLVHGPAMTESVTVVDEATAVPGPDEVAAAAKQELDDLVAKVKTKVDEVQAITGTNALVGATATDEVPSSASLNVMPKEITVKAGEKVTWTVDGFHTIAFNAPEDAHPWLQFDDTGALVINKKSYAPAASPEIPLPAAGSGDPPKLPVDAGTWDGQGYHSSGAPFTGGQVVYSLAISEPGTYKYICLVHTDMEGTLKVT
ncbi:MAG: hypothetical protein ACR2MO_17240 [Acidimicrobiales bacterium]